MATVRSLIEASLRQIGVIASGETPSANDLNDGLDALNAMAQSWANESLFIPNRVIEDFTLVASDGAYTMGTGAQFSTIRPVRIENIGLVEGTTETPLELITKNQWANIQQKMQTGRPTKAYVEGSYPNETINLWPIPTAANTLRIYSLKPIAAFTLSATLDLPPGYERALKANLSVEVAPEFGKEASPTIQNIANESKAVLKRMNHKPDILTADPAVLNRHYDIYKGEYH
jgi:hypothetical protein